MNKFCTLLTTALLLASVALSQQKGTDPDEAEIKSFELNSDRLTKFGAASKSVIANKKDRNEIEEAVQNDPDAKTISGMVRAIEKHPPVVAAIRNAGLTTREYAVMTVTLMTTVMVVSMKKQGLVKEVPNSVSAGNMAFVDQNLDKIQEMMVSMQGGQI